MADQTVPRPAEAPRAIDDFMPLDGIIFPAEGTHVFELAVGGERQRLAPLHLLCDSAAN